MMHRVVIVACLLVLAGCSSAIPGFTDATTAQDTDSVEPWSDTEFVVALDVPTNESRSRYVAALHNATAYWSNNAGRYLGHPVRLTVVPNASDPDVVVSIVDTIEQCGTENHTSGCAPVVHDLRRTASPIEIRVRSGYNRASTAAIIEHELGHVFGLGHGDEPAAVMASQVLLATAQRPNATDRPVPWDDANLTVHADLGGVSPSSRETVRRQIRLVIDYYNDGAGGSVPSNVTVTAVDDPDAADVTIEFRDQLPCGDGPGSCGLITGVDPDRDGANERFTSVEIFVSRVDPATVGWHVGRWFGTALGAETEGELPPPFQNGTTLDERSDWWIEAVRSET